MRGIHGHPSRQDYRVKETAGQRPMHALSNLGYFAQDLQLSYPEMHTSHPPHGGLRCTGNVHSVELPCPPFITVRKSALPQKAEVAPHRCSRVVVLVEVGSSVLLGLATMHRAADSYSTFNGGLIFLLPPIGCWVQMAHLACTEADQRGLQPPDTNSGMLAWISRIARRAS